MKIHEFIGKSFLNEYGINVPPSQLLLKEEKIKPPFLPCVLKSQVLVGGRMKAGGILFAENEEEFQKNLHILFNKRIKGEKPYGVLIEKKEEIVQEHYLSLFLDRKKKRITYIYSENGGIDIEESSNFISGSQDFVIKKAGPEIAKIMEKLTKLFKDKDLTLLEINPLARLQDGQIYALDAVLHLDDSALFRQEWAKEYAEKKEYPFQYVELNGNIGIIGCGAGIVMATMDAVSAKGYAPADFLDLGGGADSETTTKALELLFSRGIKTIVMNIFGGITKCDEIAKAIVDFSKKARNVRLLVRLTGTNEEMAKEILNKAGLKYFDDMYSMINAIREERS